ncbi:MAG TPA: DUF3180 domain-containing protein [Pseudonocardiaceae bacterium]|jgi:hypothetical protein
MRFTRTRDLVIAGVVVAILVNLFLRLDYDLVPPLPTLAGATFAVIAVIETWFAFSIRARINRKPGTTPIRALTAVRAVALAKASSLIGAVMVGAWLGVLVYVVPLTNLISVAGGDTRAGIVGVVSAAGLIASGLWLEHCCRTPDDPEPDPDDAPGPYSG